MSVCLCVFLQLPQAQLWGLGAPLDQSSLPKQRTDAAHHTGDTTALQTRIIQLEGQVYMHVYYCIQHIHLSQVFYCVVYFFVCNRCGVCSWKRISYRCYWIISNRDTNMTPSLWRTHTGNRHIKVSLFLTHTFSLSLFSLELV